MPGAYVSRAKNEALVVRMRRLGIRESDLTEKFVRGSGRGGQKLNKTSSCVYLKHLPSGLEIKCQRSRTRALNRHLARRELCDRMEERVQGEQSRRRQEIEKIRRQKRRRSRRQKARILEEKRRQSARKELRKPVRDFIE